MSSPGVETGWLAVPDARSLPAGEAKRSQPRAPESEAAEHAAMSADTARAPSPAQMGNAVRVSLPMTITSYPGVIGRSALRTPALMAPRAADGAARLYAHRTGISSWPHAQGSGDGQLREGVLRRAASRQPASSSALRSTGIATRVARPGSATA